GLDAHTLARGLLAGWARASTVPDETVQAWRTFTRTRRDLVAGQRAARPRLHDELIPVFPRLVGQLPDPADLGAPALLPAPALPASGPAPGAAPPRGGARPPAGVSPARWGAAPAAALPHAAPGAAASTRAVAARGLVVRTLALHLLDLHTRVAELDAALTDL